MKDLSEKLKRIQSLFNKIHDSQELFAKLQEITDLFNDLYRSIPNADNSRDCLIYLPENVRINPATGEKIKVGEDSRPSVDVVVNERIEKQSKEYFENIKKIVLKCKSAEELVRSLDYLAERINKLYFYQPNPNFNCPPVIISLLHEQNLVNNDGRLMKSTPFYMHFGIYESPEGVRYISRDERARYWANIEIESEPLFEYVGYRFIEAVTIICEDVTPIHELESHPKNMEDVLRGDSVFSLERFRIFKEAVFYNKNSERKWPELQIGVSSYRYLRPHAGAPWKRFINAFLPEKEEIVDVGEFESMDKIVHNFYIDKFDNPLDKREEHTTYITLGGEIREPDFTVTFHYDTPAEKVNKELEDRIQSLRKRGRIVEESEE